MIINPAEISRVIKTEIASYTRKADFSEAGTVIQVGDGIARIYGLYHARRRLRGCQRHLRMALNLDEDTSAPSSWVRTRSGGDPSSDGEDGRSPGGDGLLGRVVNTLGELLTTRVLAADGFRRISPAPV